MAATILTRVADFAAKFRKPAGTTALGLSPDGAARYTALTAIVVSAGAGVPTEAATNGSLYLRTNGTDGDDSLYMRIAGAWVALQGETT